MRMGNWGFAIRALQVLFAICLIGCRAEAKYRGPDTEKVAKTADLVVLGEVTYVVPADKPGDASQHLYSRVIVRVLETVHGNGLAQEVVIGTKMRMEEGDYAAYCPGHKYLLFLVKKGSIYQPVNGRTGMFEAVRGRILGWPKPSAPAYPKPSSSVEYKGVIQEVARYMSVRTGAGNYTWDASEPKQSSYRGPDTARLASASDVVALVRVQWVLPPEQQEGREESPCSRVVVSVLETVKGKAESSTLTIGARSGIQASDCYSYCPEQMYLVFLARRGSDYVAAYGDSGVFPLIGGKVQGWPKPGGSSYPKPDRAVLFDDVKAAIVAGRL